MPRPSLAADHTLRPSLVSPSPGAQGAEPTDGREAGGTRQHAVIWGVCRRGCYCCRDSTEAGGLSPRCPEGGLLPEPLFLAWGLLTSPRPHWGVPTSLSVSLSPLPIRTPALLDEVLGLRFPMWEFRRVGCNLVHDVCPGRRSPVELFPVCGTNASLPSGNAWVCAED